MYVIDDDVFSDDDVDHIYFEMSLSPMSPAITLQQTGTLRNGRLEASFRVQCSLGFTGENCTGSCSLQLWPRGKVARGRGKGEGILLYSGVYPPLRLVRFSPDHFYYPINNYNFMPAELYEPSRIMITLASF